MTDQSNSGSMLEAVPGTAADSRFIEAYKASVGRRRELILLRQTSDMFLDDLLKRVLTQNLRKQVLRELDRRKKGGHAEGGLLALLRRMLLRF